VIIATLDGVDCRGGLGNGKNFTVDIVTRGVLRFKIYGLV
jgi:hypothetical protein